MVPLVYVHKLHEPILRTPHGEIPETPDRCSLPPLTDESAHAREEAGDFRPPASPMVITRKHECCPPLPKTREAMRAPAQEHPRKRYTTNRIGKGTPRIQSKAHPIFPLCLSDIAFLHFPSSSASRWRQTLSAEAKQMQIRLSRHDDDSAFIAWRMSQNTTSACII